MKRVAKMILLRNAGEGREPRGEYRNEMRNEYRSGYDSRYEMESRPSEARGRERYDDGRFAPKNEYRSGYDYEMRARYDEHPSGREMRGSEMYEPRNYGYDNIEYPESRSPRPVRGFAPENHYDVPGRGNEMENRHSEYERGHGASTAKHGKLDKETIKKWMEALENEDDSTGAHWAIEKTKTFASPLGVQLGEQITPEMWWAAMNMMYSDYCEVGKQFRTDEPEFYAALAKAFLMDKDGGGAARKLAAYYRCIVE